MPTNQNVYNSRVTSEELEKRFRDTFTSQGGNELVSDLYAQGVIVPVVDFTAAATGQQLAQNLQTAWDFSTGSEDQTAAGTTTLISNSGFWQVDVISQGYGTFASNLVTIDINDGTTQKAVWALGNLAGGASDGQIGVAEGKFVVFLRSGDSLELTITQSNAQRVTVWYRQIATLSGDLVNPTGFTSS